jgi:hypothetical protein
VHQPPEQRRLTKDTIVNPYVGEPHAMLGRIHHEDLLARAEEARRLHELRQQNWPDGGRPAGRLLRRLEALVARRTYERRHAPRLVR